MRPAADELEEQVRPDRLAACIRQIAARGDDRRSRAYQSRYWLAEPYRMYAYWL
jgi:hypothetical protein